MSQGTLSPTATAFVESVLALQPEIAVFDCDGTLWWGDSGADFFYWEIENGLLTDDVVDAITKRYDLYKSGEVDELSICGEMVTIHKGLTQARVRDAAREFFNTVVKHRIFPELQELTHKLIAQGTEVWAVSSTNNWVVEEGVKLFGIPPKRVLAAELVFDESEVATDRLVRVPTGELKAVAINEVIARPVQAVFGNSVHDQAMLEIAQHPFAVNPNPDLHEIAEQRSWSIYWPDGRRK